MEAEKKATIVSKVVARDPVTKEEWQAAVTGAYALVLLDSARQYMLVSGGPKIDIDRCVKIISLGRTMGISPDKELGIEWLVSNYALKEKP